MNRNRNMNIALFLIIIIFVSYSSAKIKVRSNGKRKQIDDGYGNNFISNSNSNGSNFNSHKIFNEIEAKRVAFFAKLANCGEKPLPETCKACMEPREGFKMFFFYQFSRMKKFNYKILIHYNDDSKQVIVSFGAPSVDNHTYLQRIYTHGWSLVNQYRVETEFRQVYFSHLRKVLLSKVHKLKASGRLGYKFIFTGYSLGGSISVLAALDLTQSKTLHSDNNKLTVYTYGGLRIGDSNFVSLINSSFTLWRVVKQNDYMVRIPNCYYSEWDKVWRCLSEPVIQKYIFDKKFPLRAYYRRYINNKGPLGLKDLQEKANELMGMRDSTNFIEKKSKRSLTKAQQIDNQVKTYIRYIYYTQPIGREIFYNSDMTSYKSCHYVNGVSNCEKKEDLPTSFTSSAHKTYFGIDFEQCE